nr:7TM diverse intracellular signaling domain-containing protein [Caldimonas mangrovi]
MIGRAEVWVDPGGEMTLAQAQATQGWRTLARQQQFAAAPAAVWLRWRHAGEAAVVELPRTVVGHAVLYQRDDSSLPWRQLEAGDHVHPERWPLRAPEVALPVRPGSGGQPAETYLRLSHADPFVLMPLLWQREAYQSNRALDHLWVGLFLGVVTMALAFMAGEVLLRGDAVSAWYAMHVLTMAVFQLVQMGYARVYLSGGNAALTQASRLIAGTLLAAVSLLFVRRALPKALSGSRASNWALAVAAFGVLLTGLYVAWPQLAQQDHVLRVQHAFYLLVVLSVGWLLWAVRGVRLPYMHWYVAGFAAAAAGVGVQIAYVRGWLAAGHWASHAMLLGAGLEIALITYALNFSARDVLGDPGLRRDGARRDRLTGLLHSSELPSLLMAMAVRALRLGGKSSLVMLRIANLDDLKREHGATAVESALKAGARVIREACNPGDVPLRLDDDGFAVVLERVHSREEAHAMAQRILGLGLQHHPELPQLEQLHWHAAIAHVPRHLKGDPVALVDRLNQLLGQIRRGSALLVRELT